MNTFVTAFIAAALALGGAAWAQGTARPAAPAKGQQAQVVAVTDGDTLALRLPDGQRVTVRLRDIDAPEICQPWGPEARAALSELTLNKLAVLTPAGRDRYGRVVGRITVEDLDVGRHLVENGHAWSTRSRYDRGPLVKQERMAAALRRGLHGQVPKAVEPWTWRRNQGVCPSS